MFKQSRGKKGYIIIKEYLFQLEVYLCNELNNKLFSIIVDSEFIEVNKVFNFLLKFFCKLGEICLMVYEFVFIVEVVAKFYEVGELVDVSIFDLIKF